MKDRPEVRRGLCGEKGPQQLPAQVPDLLQGPRCGRPDGGVLGVHQKKVKKADRSERPSVLAKLSHFKELIKNAVVDRNKRKELER